MENGKGLLERLFVKITSGRFIFTIVVAAVYAYLACSGVMEGDRINEITLIVLYAYFTKDRSNGDNGNGDNGNH